MKRRTTYKVERIVNLGDGPEALPILETNCKRHFHEYQDEIANRENVVFIKQTSRTATVSYTR